MLVPVPPHLLAPVHHHLLAPVHPHLLVQVHPQAMPQVAALLGVPAVVPANPLAVAHLLAPVQDHLLLQVHLPVLHPLQFPVVLPAVLQVAVHLLLLAEGHLQPLVAPPAAPQVEAQVMLLLGALQLDQVHRQARAQALHQVVLQVLPPV